MENDQDITARLSRRLKVTRRDKGLSLDALAQMSGVSRSMLSQIERGQSSPTVASLWNLTRALGVDFAGLLDAEDENPIHEIIRAAQTPVIHRHGTGCHIRILSPAADVGRTEIYDISFDAGGALVSEPHKKGCREYFSLLTGAAEVTAGGQTVVLGPGDTLRYAADVPHAIRVSRASHAVLVVKDA